MMKRTAKRLELCDRLNKMQFLLGQRAGRDLWATKPVEVQQMDLDSFNNDIRFIRDYIWDLERRDLGRVAYYDIYLGAYYCPTCNERVPLGIKYCSECGQRISEFEII
jgi:uncharacterized protein (UPF0212 family)